MTDLAGDIGLEVARWRRFGHDRLYVNASDGTRIGWLDLKTGEATIEIEERRAEFDIAIAQHADTDAPPANEPDPPAETANEAIETPDVELAGEVETESEIEAEVEVEQQPVLPEPERPWTDLATNRPGEAVAAKAKEHFNAAPVRSIAARIIGGNSEERSWRVGAKGESLVAARLRKLEPEWRALHSVPVGTRGSDIDHVVIGPGGVYTINAKHHPNKSVWVGGNAFIVDGFRQPYIRNARYEANRAERLLREAAGFPVPVIGLIAVVGAHKGLTIKKQPADGRVVVVPRKQLATWLERRGPILDAGHIEAIFEVARRSTTWV